MKQPVVSGLEMIKILHRWGWTDVRKTKKGSHLIMKKEGVFDNLAIPLHDELTVGVIPHCIVVAGLTDEDFK
ncbi:MAG: type II toxin-antitoxin system HicA family toxin [Methanoregula sp.]|nr:type II toxin-antitoxin system HicA family toxin [Methanoregula sp.]